MRKQYHFWPGQHGLDAWDVDRLIRLSADLPVVDVPLDVIWELDTPYWSTPGPCSPKWPGCCAPAGGSSPR